MKCVGQEWLKCVTECLMKMSKTCMVPKVNKAEAKQHRPIAHIGYKIFMGMVK